MNAKAECFQLKLSRCTGATCFLYAAAVQLNFLDVIKTPGLPLSVEDVLFHTELYLCSCSKKCKAKLWSDKVNDILAIGYNSNRIRSRKEATSFHFSVSHFGNLNASVLCSFSLLWCNCSFAEMQHIDVLTAEKQQQIPTLFSHCFCANQSLCCFHLFRNECGQVQQPFSWRKHKTYVLTTFKTWNVLRGGCMISDKFVLSLSLLVNMICTAAFSMCPPILINEFQGSLHYYQKSFCLCETRVSQYICDRKYINQNYFESKYQAFIDISFLSIFTHKLDNSVIE